ncbi:hypothetical protein PHYPSEUDO_001307 [Phytophthora pseudosyringae]|uniref:Transmembrane protein n=1 Tax=Phytophthora pseudosyringae TaxID=221518 RepID=A0A8T1VWF9_9STRA|nr:hypothetical protein PHYPSEUDO_001307 [Phytophthora pseudosyringae]
MDEAPTVVSDQPTAASLRWEAWGSPKMLASPSETTTSESSDEIVRPATTAGSVGPRMAPAAVAASQASPVRHIHRRRRSTGDAQTVAYLEVQNVMGLVQKKLFRAQTWLDAFHVMLLVASNSFPSVLCAWAIVALYAFGSPWSPFIPEWPSSFWSAPTFSASNLREASDEFDAVVGFYFVLTACVGHLVAKSFTVGNRLFTFSAGMWSLDPNAPGFRKLLGRNFIATGAVLMAAVAAGTFIMELLRFFDVDFRKDGRLQLYILSLISYAYVSYAEVFIRLKLLRRIRRSLVFLPASVVPSPLDGIGPALPSSSLDLSIVHSKTRGGDKPQRTVALGELMRQLLRAQALPLVTFHVAFLFLHVAAALSLRERWEAMLFAGASQVLKLGLQEAAKRLQLSHSRQRHSARMVHTVMTVPTICIDAPVRLVFMQKGVDSSSIVTSSLALVVFEVLFRMTKILRLRYVVSTRLANSRIMRRVLHRVNSRLQGRDMVRARAEYSRFLDWKNYRLRLHAAEIYADMHGKYVSIGLAVAMLYMLRTHPRYDFGYMSSSTSTQLLAATVQLGTGLAADLVACAFEGIQEVPMYGSLADEGSPLLRYLRLLMSVLTAVNVGVIALFAMQPQDGRGQNA